MLVCYLQLCCKRRIFAQNKPEMDKHTVSLKAKRLQSAGIVLSLLCAVHCMALPLLLMAGSFAAVSVLSNPWMELGLLPVGFAIAGWVLYKDYRLHSRKMPLLTPAWRAARSTRSCCGRGGVNFPLSFIYWRGRIAGYGGSVCQFQGSQSILRALSCTVLNFYLILLPVSSLSFKCSSCVYIRII